MTFHVKPLLQHRCQLTPFSPYRGDMAFLSDSQNHSPSLAFDVFSQTVKVFSCAAQGREQSGWESGCPAVRMAGGTQCQLLFNLFLQLVLYIDLKHVVSV